MCYILKILIMQYSRNYKSDHYEQKKYFEEEVIQQTLDYNYAQHSDAAKFNIAYGIDKNFLFGCGVSIASVLLANPERR